MHRVIVVSALVALVGCTEPEAFELAFAPTDGASRVDCASTVTGVGPDGAYGVGLADLRFYVSGLQFLDADGEPIQTTLDEDDFQYAGASAWVALVDLTGTDTGSCAAGAISGSEGTARTHTSITGTTRVDEVAAVRFDVGVPQALMREVIGSNTAEGAPSPLREMYWSWASGYRHFVLNLTIDGPETDGEGYLHVGSRNCAGEGELALETRDTCEFVNNPAVHLDDFDLTTDTVAVDLVALLDGVDFVVPVLDHETMEPIGETTGVACHSSPMQPDCAPVFASLGLDLATGDARSGSNEAFGRE